MRSLTLTLPLALLLASCSLLGDDEGTNTSSEATLQRGSEFIVWSFPATTPMSWQHYSATYEGVLVAGAMKQIYVNVTALHLEFDDSTQTLELTPVTEEDVPVAVGNRYRVTTQFVPMLIGQAGSVTVTDASGLVFYGTTNLGAGDTIDPPPPPGWKVKMDGGGYGQHDLGCGLGGSPQNVVVTHEGESVRLVQGQSKQLGAYRVTMLIAERVERTGEVCPDFGAPELSYTITRTGK